MSQRSVREERRRCQMRLVWAIALVSGTAGCSQVVYLAQAAWGQLELQSRAEPIERILAQGRAPERLAALLRGVPAIKTFAAQHGLAVLPNYAQYAELDREAAVWVVTACEPLQFVPKTWRFPLVGSFPYLGWFDRLAADDYAQYLAGEGWDVYVRGASAYSTLGWFDDPVLSTMLTRGASVSGDLVNTILHESVHATIHVRDQGTFNESLATFVGDGLTPVYLRQAHGEDAPELVAWLAEEARRRERRDRLLAAYNELVLVYDSDLSNTAKRQRKAEILESLKRDLDAKQELNNATLQGFRTYREGAEQLASLLRACDGDWRRFLATVEGVTPVWFAEEQQEDLQDVLQRLVNQGCATDPAEG